MRITKLFIIIGLCFVLAAGVGFILWDRFGNKKHERRNDKPVVLSHFANGNIVFSF